MTLVQKCMIIENSFASHSRAKIFQYKYELSNRRKDIMSITDYVMRIKDIVMQLSSCGYKVSEEDQVHALLHGIDNVYDLVHVVVSSKMEPVIVREVWVMLLTHEKRLKNTIMLE